MSLDPPPPPPSPAVRPLVLVVDDYADARMLYREYLELSGFDVAEAQTGLEALSQARRLLPRAVLMDVSLPGMDGWEATRQLKADPLTRKIPVVALTGHSRPGLSQSAKEAGCDVLVTKPCRPEALLAELQRVMGATGPGD